MKVSKIGKVPRHKPITKRSKLPRKNKDLNFDKNADSVETCSGDEDSMERIQ